MSLADAMNLKQIRRKITYSESFYRFISGLGAGFIKAYLGLLSIRVQYHPKIKDLDHTKALYAFWHGQLLLPIHIFQNTC